MNKNINLFSFFSYRNITFLVLVISLRQEIKSINLKASTQVNTHGKKLFFFF